jgi:ACS family hexuronate transporter-like MFS transporter
MYLGGGWLLDRIGTRKGFLLIMSFWSLACASHGLARNALSLAFSRLLLGCGEGGGFPAATRAVAEWYSPNQRAFAMGIINGGTAIGAVAAPPLIVWILTYGDWLGIASWRWVFFVTGAIGLAWALVWALVYSTPLETTPRPTTAAKGEDLSVSTLIAHKEVVGIVFAKFLSDAAWFFYLFWLPKYLFEAQHFDLKQAGTIGWIPYAASGLGCLLGGGFSSYLLHRGFSVNASRKLALGASAAMMPWVMLVPSMPNVGWVLFLFSLAFFGQQSWSTLVMILPTDLVPHRALGKLAGLVGLGGAMGGVVLGQLAGWLLDNGFSYTPVLCLAASLHVIAFGVICLALPRIKLLNFESQ